MFRTADTTRRTPVYLQAHTKENLIWQLKMTVLMFVGIGLKDWYDKKKQKNRYL